MIFSNFSSYQFSHFITSLKFDYTDYKTCLKKKKTSYAEIKTRENKNEVEKWLFYLKQDSLIQCSGSSINAIFLYFFSEELDHTVETVRYNTQKIGSSASTIKTDLKQFLGIYILSSIVQLPNMKYFWGCMTVAAKIAGSPNCSHLSIQLWPIL